MEKKSQSLDYKEIPITRFGKTVGYLKVDNEDYEKLNQGKVYCNKQGYPCISIKLSTNNWKCFRVHRLIINTKKGEYVDHIFHDKFDCRKSQLRIATPSENCSNLKLNSKNTTGYRGVYKNGKNGYKACVEHFDTTIYCGTYDSPEKANQAIKNKRAELKMLDVGILPTIVPIQREYKNISKKSNHKHIAWNNKNKKWVVSICLNYNRIYVGTFNDLKEAIIKRNLVRKELGLSELTEN